MNRIKEIFNIFRSYWDITREFVISQKNKMIASAKKIITDTQIEIGHFRQAMKEKIQGSYRWTKEKARKFKQTIITIMVGGSIIVTSSISPAPVEIGTMTQVNIAGERAQYVFQCGNELIPELATATDYNSRFEKGGSGEKPIKEGCSFKGGRRFYIYNTVNEELNANQYAKNIEQGVQKYYIQLDTGRYLNLSEAEVNSIKSLQ